MNSNNKPLILAFIAAILVLTFSYFGAGYLTRGQWQVVFAEELSSSFIPVIVGEKDNQPEETATPQNTPTMTLTNTPSPTATPTDEPTSTLTPTATATPTMSATLTATPTMSATATSTATPTMTPTMTPTPTETPAPPSITSFIADDSSMFAGESTYLRWTTIGIVEGIELDPIGVLSPDTTNYQISPAEATTYTLTISNSFGSDTSNLIIDVGQSTEILVYEWDREMLKKHKGFGFIQPPQANGNWVDPVDFTGGRVYMRAQIRSMPVIQNLRLQICFWQLPNLSVENCSSQKRVFTKAGVVVEWDDKLDELWMKNLLPVDWSQPRVKYGALIRNEEGLNVSDFHEWEWNGEDPDEWYPLDMLFQAVVVAEGAEFSGWQNYIP